MIINYSKFDDISKYLKINLLGLGLLIFVPGCNIKEELKQDPKIATPISKYYYTFRDNYSQQITSVVGF